MSAAASLTELEIETLQKATKLKNQVFECVSNLCVNHDFSVFKVSDLLQDPFSTVRLATEIKLKLACESLVLESKISIVTVERARITTYAINYDEACKVAVKIERKVVIEREDEKDKPRKIICEGLIIKRKKAAKKQKIIEASRSSSGSAGGVINGGGVMRDEDGEEEEEDEEEEDEEKSHVSVSPPLIRFDQGPKSR